MDWEYILKKARNYREIFLRAHKCLNIDRDTKPETISKHITTLLETLESVRVLFNANYSRLTRAHQVAAEAFFSDLREKAILVCDRKGIEVSLPISIHEKIIHEHKLSTEIDISVQQPSTRRIRPETNMAQTVVEFLGTATRILPSYDGSAVNLQSFLDALTLLDTIKDNHETVAISLIKTKLVGTARNLISTEATIQQIINKLKSSVKGESVEVIQSKILNIKQQGKNANAYANEIEDLTKRLETAYISDGLPNETAKKYATNSAVAAIVKNATNEKVKLVMESGNFKDMNEAISKFINSCNGAHNQQNAILAYGSGRSQVQNNYQRRGRRNYRQPQDRNSQINQNEGYVNESNRRYNRGYNYNNNNNNGYNNNNRSYNNNNRSYNNNNNRGYNNSNRDNRNYVHVTDSTENTSEN